MGVRTWVARGVVGGLVACASSADAPAPSLSDAGAGADSGDAGSLFEAVGSYDLDGDGKPESDLTLGPCRNVGRTCLLMRSATLGDHETFLADFDVQLGSLGTMGKHFGNLETVYVYGGFADTAHLWVVDVLQPRPKAETGAPSGWVFTRGTGGGPGGLHASPYFALVRGPDQKKYPLLAPGANYVPSKNDSATWTQLCQFDPTRFDPPDPACGAGFRSATTLFSAGEVSGPLATLAKPTDTFRHAGGWLADADDDGWDDLHLPYLWLVKTVSGRTGASLMTTPFDVASAVSTPTTVGFHSGRNYGSFASFTMSNGQTGVLIASGNPVGNFTDYNCNVSRFHALLETPKPNPTGRKLAWASYASFVKSLFASPYTQTPPVVLRPGDALDKCIHRFSSALFRTGDKNVTVYSLFSSDKPPNDCNAEQYAEVQNGFSTPFVDAWNKCAKASFLPTPGAWSVRTLDAETGGALGEWPNAYAWGKSERLVPNGNTVFLIEPLAGKVRFDRVGVASAALAVATLDAAGKWTTLGTFPVAGTPKVVERVPIEGPVGTTNYGIVELDAKDVDADGLDDVLLTGGERVGWSTKAQAFVVKK